MANLLIFGIDPLPESGTVYLSGPANRTWHFVKPLINRGHSITLICLNSDDKAIPSFSKRDLSEKFGAPLVIYNCSYESFINIEKVNEIVNEVAPDAVIGTASILPSYIASHFADKYPFWADFFGCPIAEIQSKSEVYNDDQSDSDLFHVWKMMKKILDNADKFSSVSNRHKHSIIGQLAMEGRLNRFSAGYDFIHSMPCAFDIHNESMNTYTPDKPSYIRGIKTNKNDFLVYWSGFYNTWMDEETLFYGLESAIKTNPRIKYISTGGGITGYNEKSYKKFCELVNNSHVKDNFILLGWVDAELIPQCYQECDLGINIDRFTYEGTLGSRNRIIHFLKAGLPVLSTNITELTEDLSRNNLIHTFEIGNCKDLSLKLTELAENKFLLLRNIDNAKDFVSMEYNFENCVKDFLKFADQPEFSPDKKEKMNRQSENNIENTFLNEAEKYSKFRETDYDEKSILRKFKKFLF